MATPSVMSLSTEKAKLGVEEMDRGITENSATLVMEGYFQRQSWFWLKPWLERISRSCLFHCSAHT